MSRRSLAIGKAELCVCVRRKNLVKYLHWRSAHFGRCCESNIILWCRAVLYVYCVPLFLFCVNTIFDIK